MTWSYSILVIATERPVFGIRGRFIVLDPGERSPMQKMDLKLATKLFPGGGVWLMGQEGRWMAEPLSTRMIRCPLCDALVIRLLPARCVQDSNGFFLRCPACSKQAPLNVGIHVSLAGTDFSVRGLPYPMISRLIPHPRGV